MRRAYECGASAAACARMPCKCATCSLCCGVQGVLIWHSSKTTELLKALLMRQPADAEGPPPQQHSALSAGRRFVAPYAGFPCLLRRHSADYQRGRCKGDKYMSGPQLLHAHPSSSCGPVFVHAHKPVRHWQHVGAGEGVEVLCYDVGWCMC